MAAKKKSGEPPEMTGVLGPKVKPRAKRSKAADAESSADAKSRVGARHQSGSVASLMERARSRNHPARERLEENLALAGRAGELGAEAQANPPSERRPDAVQLREEEEGRQERIRVLGSDRQPNENSVLRDFRREGAEAAIRLRRRGVEPTPELVEAEWNRHRRANVPLRTTTSQGLNVSVPDPHEFNYGAGVKISNQHPSLGQRLGRVINGVGFVPGGGGTDAPATPRSQLPHHSVRQYVVQLPDGRTYHVEARHLRPTAHPAGTTRDTYEGSDRQQLDRLAAERRAEESSRRAFEEGPNGIGQKARAWPGNGGNSPDNNWPTPPQTTQPALDASRGQVQAGQQPTKPPVQEPPASVFSTGYEEHRRKLDAQQQAARKPEIIRDAEEPMIGEPLGKAQALHRLHQGLEALVGKDANLTRKDELMSTTLRKDSPWDVDSSAPPPTPLHGAQKQSPMWLGRYPMVRPEDQQELEQDAAVNEFGRRLPREHAEAAAHEGYVKRQREQAMHHHLAGMKGAHAAGDMESARKHGLMYQLHARALGLDPSSPPRAPLEFKPQRKFTPHRADMYAAKPFQAPSQVQGEVISSSPPPAALQRHEALGRLLGGLQALLKGEKPESHIKDSETKTLCGEGGGKTRSWRMASYPAAATCKACRVEHERRSVESRKPPTIKKDEAVPSPFAGSPPGAPQEATKAPAASSRTPEEHQLAMQQFYQQNAGKTLPFFGFQGGHFKLGPSVYNYTDGVHQVPAPGRIQFMKRPIARVQVQRDQEGNHRLVDENGLTWKSFGPEGQQLLKGDLLQFPGGKAPVQQPHALAPASQIPHHDANTRDYGHRIWPQYQAAGYGLQVRHDPENQRLHAELQYRGRPAGVLSASLRGGVLGPTLGAPEGDILSEDHPIYENMRMALHHRAAEIHNEHQARQPGALEASLSRLVHLNGDKTDKAELRPNRPKPCRCSALSFPHRHGGHRDCIGR